MSCHKSRTICIHTNLPRKLGATRMSPREAVHDRRARVLLRLQGMMSSTEDFASHVANHAGVTIERAERVARAVLASIGAYLSPARRDLVADELPPALAAALLANAGMATPLDERVLSPGMTTARAHELVASVCRVLAEELSADAIRALRLSVPIGIAALLATPAPELVRRPPALQRHETLVVRARHDRLHARGARPRA